MVHLPGIACFHNNSHLHPFPGFYEVMMYCCNRQKRRNRCVIFRNITIGKNDVVFLLVNRLFSISQHFYHGHLKSFCSLFYRKHHRDGFVRKHRIFQILNLPEVGIDDDGAFEFYQFAVIRGLCQNIGMERTNIVGKRHHQTFPNRVDGRIGYLRKHLFEIVKQPFGLV